jgi:hypothetical protein
LLYSANIVHFLHEQDFLTEQEDIKQLQDLFKILLCSFEQDRNGQKSILLLVVIGENMLFSERKTKALS